jgi:hypothetical protein
MYITTHTTHFNLAETWPGVYWGTLGATTLESLNFDFCFLPDQSFMLPNMLRAPDIDFSESVSSVVHACATSKACPSVQLVGMTSAHTQGLIEES